MKVCPRCRSTSIHPYALMMGFRMDNELREYCMNCGYGYNEQVVFEEAIVATSQESSRRA